MRLSQCFYEVSSSIAAIHRHVKGSIDIGPCLGAHFAMGFSMETNAAMQSDEMSRAGLRALHNGETSFSMEGGSYYEVDEGQNGAVRP